MAQNAETIFRDFVTDGVPSSGANKPKKSAIRAWGTYVETGLTDLGARVGAVEGQDFDTRVDLLELTAAGTQADITDLQAADSALTARMDTVESTVATSFHRSAAVVARTTANVDLANGGIANGTTHDGVTVATGDRILVASQSASVENGVYLVPASGAASRSGDGNTGEELSGLAVKATGGATYGGTVWLCTATNITIGTTPIGFLKIDDDTAIEASFAATANAVRRDIGAAEPGIAGGILQRARAANYAPKYDAFTSNNGTRFEWVAAGIMGADDRLDAMRFFIDDEGRSPNTIEADLYVQPAALASSGQVTDITNYQLIDHQRQAAGRYFTLGGGLQQVDMPLAAPQFLAEGTRWVYVVRLLDSNNDPVASGFGFARHQTNDEETFVKGGFATSAGLGSISSISAGNKIYVEPLSMRFDVDQSRVAARLTPVFGRKAGALIATDFYRLSFNGRPEKAIRRPGAFGFYIGEADDVVYLRLRVFTRPYVNGNYAQTGYALGSEADDKIVFADTYLAGDYYADDPVLLGGMQYVELPTPGMPAIGPDTIVMYELTGYASDQVTAKTFRTAEAGDLPTAEWPLLTGSYSLSSTPGDVQNYSGNPFFFNILEETPVEASRDGATPVIDRMQFIDPLTQFPGGGFTVAMPRLSVWGAERSTVIPAQSVAIDAVSGLTAVTDTITLRYLQRDPLTYRFWSDAPVVTRTSDSATLTEGVDYEISEIHGTIKGLQDVDDFEVEVAYNGYPCRVDMIVLTAWDQTYSVFKGTEKPADPDNWRTDVDSITSNGRIRVAEVLVDNGGVVEVIDRTGYHPRSMIAYGRESEIFALQKWNHEQLAPARLAMMRGENITYIAYGDSISACAGGAEAEWQTVPGGPTRDVRGYLTIQTSDDSLAHMGTPAVTESDGIDHWYGSMHRRMATAIEDRYGITVDFKNLGIGGTNTGPGGTGTPTDRYGGSNTTRLAGILSAKGATGVTVVGVAFGTNEDDDNAMINYLATIGRYIRSNGMIPLFFGQPALAHNVIRAEDRQRRNDARIMRVARTVPGAYVPLASMIAIDKRGASGIFRNLTSTAGGVNHPGIFEHKMYGEWGDFLCFR